MLTNNNLDPSIYSLIHMNSKRDFTVLLFCLRPHFSLDIKTKSSKGLILHVAGRGVIPLLALYVANGKIKMSLGQNRIIQHKQKSNDGNWHRVSPILLVTVATPVKLSVHMQFTMMVANSPLDIHLDHLWTCTTRCICKMILNIHMMATYMMMIRLANVI